MENKENNSEKLTRLSLGPEEIITLNDFPVYSQEVLKNYYAMCQKGIDIPPVPVMRIGTVESFLSKEIFDDFKIQHPRAKYFMLDGSHRTSASTLNGIQIQAIIIDSNQDIRLADEALDKGDMFGLTIGNTIEDCIKNLVDHFDNKPEFQTVLEKTNKMVTEKVIPKYMINNFSTIK